MSEHHPQSSVPVQATSVESSHPTGSADHGSACAAPQATTCGTSKAERAISPITLRQALARDPGLREAQRMFHQFLARWASDVLVIRRAGLDRPGWVHDRPIDLRAAVTATD